MVLSNRPRLLLLYLTIMWPTGQGYWMIKGQQCVVQHPVGQWKCRSEEVFFRPYLQMSGEAFKQSIVSSCQIVYNSPHLIRFDDTKTLHYTWRTVKCTHTVSLQDSSKRRIGTLGWPELSIRLFIQCARSQNYFIRRVDSWLIANFRWMVSMYNFTTHLIFVWPYNDGKEESQLDATIKVYR